MTKLERIATDHHVHRHLDSCGDPVIPGKNGHLYTDDGHVMACFTDDGRKKPFTKFLKTSRMKMIQPFAVKFKQEGEYEFIAEIRDDPNAIRTALFRVLGVKRIGKPRGLAFPSAKKALPGAEMHPEAPGGGKLP